MISPSGVSIDDTQVTLLSTEILTFLGPNFSDLVYAHCIDASFELHFVLVDGSLEYKMCILCCTKSGGSLQ